MQRTTGAYMFGKARKASRLNPITSFSPNTPEPKWYQILLSYQHAPIRTLIDEENQLLASAISAACAFQDKSVGKVELKMPYNLSAIIKNASKHLLNHSKPAQPTVQISKNSLSSNQLHRVNSDYCRHKNGFFNLRWLDVSKETEMVKAKLKQETDPQKRFEIARDYVIQNPKREYAKALINNSSELREAAKSAKTTEPKSSSFWVWRGMGF